MKFRQKLDDIINKIFKYSQIFRGYPFCHSRPDRSLCYNDRRFGLCARCTAMYVGGFSTILLFPIWHREFSGLIGLVLGMILMTPAGVDGTTQMFGRRESNNKLRVLTGLPLGTGIPLIIWWGVELLI